MIQSKLLVSPDEKHLLTIASDSENCWENYQNDGRDFLENIYSMIEDDESLETVLISDYIEQDQHKKSLQKIYSGSWIDKTFQFWIGDAEKNNTSRVSQPNRRNNYVPSFGERSDKTDCEPSDYRHSKIACFTGSETRSLRKRRKAYSKRGIRSGIWRTPCKKSFAKNVA